MFIIINLNEITIIKFKTFIIFIYNKSIMSMFMANTKIKGTDDHEGSVAKVFQKMSNIIEENDGTRTFEWITDTCHDQQVPFTKDKETRIALTSTQH